MTVDIRGTNEKNKGALLMVEAVCERLGPHAELSANPFAASWETRARLGLRQTLHDFNAIRAANVVGDLVPGRLKERYGLVADNDLTGIVDASGFAYSDSFALGRHRREAVYGRRWAKRGVPKILLPQAFGPFNDPEKRKWCAEVVNQATVTFARDEKSLEYVRALAPGARVELSPDFTIGLSPQSGPNVLNGAVALVPNQKMVSEGILERQAYLDTMVELAQAARAHGLTELVVVLHEDDDVKLGTDLARLLDCPLRLPEPPRALKHTLGTASLVISSRFHAIVGALSQRVPTVAVGWSHKYAELLRDFDVPNWLWTPGSAAGDVLDAVLSDGEALNRLEVAHKTLTDRNDQMWETVISALGLPPRKESTGVI
ncbi:colanic acid/amylovoran biosynthesis protein [Jatrophihabitans sp. GAS493]|uniref:polysaccharide pyruvyl transferase family protein n=1 Tax=Jatrophihabitans sp. GAS493 TaxID=1907575 RepID=UPI000BB84D44|nr:polysaccharide pyruvyl transferase family protein [Jatrophihabitans sp. GAS493]SOD71571.1 colanic acid/amylovoran biosynthesis protein [Jatrophihabitans sp. GAS493]